MRSNSLVFMGTFNYVCYELFSNESSLKEEAKLSEKEAAETARRYAAGIGWISDFTQNVPHIMYEEKLVWDVFFSPTQDGLPVRGGCLRIYIDNETGEVINKVIGTR